MNQSSNRLSQAGRKQSLSNVKLTYFTFDDDYADGKTLKAFLSCLGSSCKKRGMRLKVSAGSQEAINYTDSVGKYVSPFAGGIHVFLELGTVKERSGFFDDIVEPGMRGIRAILKPVATCNLNLGKTEYPLLALTEEQRSHWCEWIAGEIEAALKSP